MGFQSIFKRYEIKYLITKEQRKIIEQAMKEYMRPDKFGRSTICNIYFDTPDYLLIRRSIEKPEYKEKLRLRSYGVATPDSTTFIELKKKYKSIVYKRRIDMPEKDSVRFLYNREKVANSQIAKEIDYCFERYDNLQPKVFLSYEREAFYSKTDHNFRMTFDENILWRTYDLSLCKGVYGIPIIDEDMSLMEVKTAGAIPLWLTKVFSENKIYRTSFSKYGTAYKIILDDTLPSRLKTAPYKNVKPTIREAVVI